MVGTGGFFNPRGELLFIDVLPRPDLYVTHFFAGALEYSVGILETCSDRSKSKRNSSAIKEMDSSIETKHSSASLS